MWCGLLALIRGGWCSEWIGWTGWEMVVAGKRRRVCAGANSGGRLWAVWHGRLTGKYGNVAHRGHVERLARVHYRQ